MQWIAICCCFSLLGANLAVITRANVLFYHRTANLWRIFLFGKSILTSYAGLTIWTRNSSDESLTWRTFVVLFAMVISALALVALYKRLDERSRADA